MTSTVRTQHLDSVLDGKVQPPSSAQPFMSALDQVAEK